MWKAPNRTDNNVTQPFSSGVVTIYSITDIAEPGYKPKEGLSQKVTLRYEEQRLGIRRYYAGMQNQIEIERVIRTPHTGEISNQDVAITEDSKQYQIGQVQSVTGVWPPCVDVTLARIEQEYEVPEK